MERDNGVSNSHPRTSNYMKSCPKLMTSFPAYPELDSAKLVFEIHFPVANAYLINLNFGVKICFINVKVCVVIWEATNWGRRLKLKNKNDIYLAFWKYK